MTRKKENNQDNIKYFEVMVKLGHQGNKRHIESNIYVKASNILSAVEKARQYAGVKHGKYPLQTREVSKEEYEDGRKHGFYNSVFRKNKKGKKPQKIIKPSELIGRRRSIEEVAK